MWTALVVSLVLGAPPTKETPAKRDEDRDLKILARGVWPVRQRTPAQLVIRNGEELALAHRIDAEHAKQMRMQMATEKDVAALLKVKTIDWRKHMLVVVAAGTRPTGGYGVEVLTLPIREKSLTIHWKLNRPAPGSVVSQGMTYPAQMVLVECFKGTVQFNPPIKDR